MKSSDKPTPLEATYRNRRDSTLEGIAKNLEAFLIDFMKGQDRIDRIAVRAKGVQSFIKKANKTVDGKPKYTEPLMQIQDQIGARIIVFYNSDVEPVKKRVLDVFRAIEDKRFVPDSLSEFGYFGHHFILAVPSDVVEVGADKSMVPDFFELQIKTLFQHSWSEANHDLAYKDDEKPLTPDQRRRVAFTSAQAWGADHIFDQLFHELRDTVVG
ncbi:MAG: RelA/SpoT domain-containing protein [Fimbriimonadaceae bacterium]